MRIPYKGQACRVTSPFGNRIINGATEFHRGIDLVGLNGDRQLVAPCSGKVAVSTMIPRSSGNLTWQWGNYVRIDTDDGLSIYMCHMEKRLVSVGQRVNYGTPVGIQGNTGYSFGEHCHFEVRQNGVSINPAPLIGIENKVGSYRDAQGLDFSVGDPVRFVGTNQYSYSQGVNPVKAEPCMAHVTAIYPTGKHPYHVTGSGVYGWVDTSDLLDATSRWVRVTCYRLNVRSGAGTGFPVLGVLKQGDEVLIAKEANNGWGKIHDSSGWISLAFTEDA